MVHDHGTLEFELNFEKSYIATSVGAAILTSFYHLGYHFDQTLNIKKTLKKNCFIPHDQYSFKKGQEKKEGTVEETNSCNDTTIIQLPRLRQLELDDLPNLKSIYKGVMVCDSLRTIKVFDCPNLKRLPLSKGNEQPAPAALKQIRGNLEWWRSLRWDHPDDVTFFHQFLESDFNLEDFIDKVDTARHDIL
ncbi:hypothetical protein L1049_012631 [Liquidambar formosana]|uniref:Uncharacterized protein n=1 Tax=Liquidambar formosana TaxID=63359 RepID=A0AAP0N763_LIQFO